MLYLFGKKSVELFKDNQNNKVIYNHFCNMSSWTKVEEIIKSMYILKLKFQHKLLNGLLKCGYWNISCLNKA